MIRIYIDVYNILPRTPETSIVQLIQDVARSCLPLVGGPRNDVEARLYGGWHDGMHQTKTAQLVSAAIKDKFPSTEKSLIGLNGLVLSKVSAYMAVTMEGIPSEILHGTFREKSPDWRIKVRPSEEFNCDQSDCLLNLLRRSLRKQQCKISGCNRPIVDALYRAEQKMVDTMMCCDLMGQNTSIDDLIVVVSDDTDFFPPVRYLIESGVSVAWVVKNNDFVFLKRLENKSNFKLVKI